MARSEHPKQSSLQARILLYRLGRSPDRPKDTSRSDIRVSFESTYMARGTTVPGERVTYSEGVCDDSTTLFPNAKTIVITANEGTKEKIAGFPMSAAMPASESGRRSGYP